MNSNHRSNFSIQSLIALALIVCLAVMGPARVSAKTFNDVPTDYWAFSFIETLAANGITAGCGGGNYCPDDSVTRAQMAVFLERGMNNSDFNPPTATGNVFLDVGANDFAANFIEQLFLDGITAGCGGNNYCPNDAVTRAQMAIFLLRSKYGAGYSPPPPNGVFADVDVSYWAAAWIEQLAAEGITAGCGGGNYCPDDPVTRAQMAVLLVRTFNLKDPLTVNSGDDIVINEADIVRLVGIVGGLDASLLTFEWSQASGIPVDLTNASESEVIVSAPDIAADTTVLISLTVTANDGRTASDTVEVTIRNYDQPFDDTTPRMIATGGTDVDLQSLKTLSETYQGLGASFEWTQLSGPAVNLLGTSAESARFTAPVVQGESTLVFRLVAEYQNGITMSDTIPISNVPKTVENVLSALADFNDVDPAERAFTREDIVKLLDQNADSLKNFISQSSRNLLRMDFDILDWITVDKNTTDYPLGGGSVVRDVVNAMSSFADLGQYDKVLPLIFPLEQGFPGCQAFLFPVNWNTINGNFLLGAAWLSGFDMGCVRKGRIAHEIGHTFGFLHSFGLRCAKEPPIPMSTIDPTDMNDSCLSYGGAPDFDTPFNAAIFANTDFDMMGGDHTSRYEDFFPLHYQAIWQVLAGWLHGSQVLVPDGSGEYLLTTLESLTPTPKAMRISLGDDHELFPQYYWLQTREFSPCEVDVRLQASHIFTGPNQLQPSRPVAKFDDGRAHSYFASGDIPIAPGGVFRHVESKVFLDKPFWDPYRGIHIAMLGCEEGGLADAVRLEVNFSPLTIDPPIVASLANTTATITLTNGGTVPIDMNTASIGGRHPDAFSIDSDQCSNSSLAPDASCEIVVSHVPTNLFDLAVLKIPNSDSVAPEIAVSLFGAQ